MFESMANPVGSAVSSVSGSPIWLAAAWRGPCSTVPATTPSSVVSLNRKSRKENRRKHRGRVASLRGGYLAATDRLLWMIPGGYVGDIRHDGPPDDTLASSRDGTKTAVRCRRCAAGPSGTHVRILATGVSVWTGCGANRKIRRRGRRTRRRSGSSTSGCWPPDATRSWRRARARWRGYATRLCASRSAAPSIGRPTAPGRTTARQGARRRGRRPRSIRRSSSGLLRDPHRHGHSTAMSPRCHSLGAGYDDARHGVTRRVPGPAGDPVLSDRVPCLGPAPAPIAFRALRTPR